MTHLYRKALLKADEVRTQLELNMVQPVNIFDSCLHLGLSVRFVDINMEGLYIKQKEGIQPTILLSNQRPLPRRCFTCAHELGHHFFNHGFKLDALSDQSMPSPSNDSDEFLVDSFAGALLMPVLGIHAEFAKRNWTPEKSTATQFFTICSIFGTGYQTLVGHCKANGIISHQKANSLLKFTPATIFKSLFQSKIQNSHFKIIDCLAELPTIDLEVSNYIILPQNMRVEGDHLQKLQETSVGVCYLATKPGVTRIISFDGNWGSFIRIQNLGYIGLAEYRHLENVID